MVIWLNSKGGIMAIVTLTMGNTTAGQFLKRGEGADAGKIVSAEVEIVGGATDSITNLAETASVTANADGSVTVVATSLELEGTSSPLILTDNANNPKEITVNSSNELLLEGALIKAAKPDEMEASNSASKLETLTTGTVRMTGSSFYMLGYEAKIVLRDSAGTSNNLYVDTRGRLSLPAKVLASDVTDPIHGEQRIKDGILETYIQGKWTWHKPTYYPNKPQDHEISMWVNNMSSLYWNVHSQLIHTLNGHAVINYNTDSLKVFRIAVATYNGFWMRFQLPYAQRLLGISFVSSTTGAAGTDTWDYEGSVDGVTWNRLIASQNLTGTHPYKLIDDHMVEHEFDEDDTCYRFLRARHTSGTMPSASSAYICLVNIKSAGRSDSDTARLHFNLNDRLDWTISATDMDIFDATYGDLDMLITDRGHSEYLRWNATPTTINSKEIEWDMGNKPRRLNGIQLLQDNANTHGIWHVDVYDGITWNRALTSYTLGGSTISFTSFDTARTGYKWRLQGAVTPGNTSGTQSKIWTIAAAEIKSKYLGGDRTAICTLTVPDVTVWHASSNNTSLLLSSNVTTGDNLKFRNATVLDKTIEFSHNRDRIWCGIKLTQSTTATHGVWQLQTSDTGTIWDNEGSIFTLGGALVSEHNFVPAVHVAKKYIRLIGISGNGSNVPWVRDIDFLYLPDLR